MHTKTGLWVVLYSLRERERRKREFVWEREREYVCVCIYAKQGCFAGSALQVVSASVSETDGEHARERNFFCMCACMYVCVGVGEGGWR